MSTSTEMGTVVCGSGNWLEQGHDFTISNGGMVVGAVMAAGAIAGGVVAFIENGKKNYADGLDAGRREMIESCKKNGVFIDENGKPVRQATTAPATTINAAHQQTNLVLTAEELQALNTKRKAAGVPEIVQGTQLTTDEEAFLAGMRAAKQAAPAPVATPAPAN